MEGRNAMSEKGRYASKAKGNPEKTEALASKFWNAAYTGYVNFNPSDAQKDAFVTWADSAEPFLIMQLEAEKGRKFTFATDKDGVTFTASCMERDNRSVNAGLIATARGRSIEIALFRLLFYISQLFPENWNELHTTVNLDRW